MDVLNKITQILENHECVCYKIDRKNNILNYIGQNVNCCSLNTAIAGVTGFLITNNIEYTMTKDYSIILK